MAGMTALRKYLAWASPSASARHPREIRPGPQSRCSPVGHQLRRLIHQVRVGENVPVGVWNAGLVSFPQPSVAAEYRTDSKHWSTQKAGNVAVADGKLRIALKKEVAGDKQYTGGGVISKQAFRYGYYEARFKVPPGAGWHTSFWMMKHDGAGGTGTKTAAQELDVCENDSVDPKGYGVNTHKWIAPHQTFGNKHIKTPELSADFHVFGCEFTPQTVKYYFGGELVQTVDATKFEHGDQQIWLTSIASSLGKTKAVDDTKLPAVAEFDYVRFYEKKP
jgi:beta-glucanase (GH16 family)